MDFYGLPEFLSYAILVGIAIVLIRENKDANLIYWLAGWVIILLHAGVYMLVIPGFIADLLGRGLLASAGIMFAIAARYWSAKISTPRILPQLIWIGLPNVLFAVVSTACAKAHYGSLPFWWMVGVAAVSAVCSVWTIAGRRTLDATRNVLLGLMCCAYGPQIALLFFSGPTLASQWQMFWIYCAVAYFCVRQIPRFTMGVAFVAISFVLWGLVFPVYTLLQLYEPRISGNINPMIWNLPKFLTAASMILVLLEEKVAIATLLATHDALTGLPNRRLYEDRVERALSRAKRTGGQFAVLIVDLNRFKQINDTLGHHAGDELLKGVSRLLLRALRDSDTVARTGGDEFTLVFDDISDHNDSEQRRNGIRQSLQARLLIEDKAIDVEASIGLAIFPEDGTTILELHSVADQRMYMDKERSKMPTGAADGALVGLSSASLDVPGQPAPEGGVLSGA